MPRKMHPSNFWAPLLFAFNRPTFVCFRIPIGSATEMEAGPRVEVCFPCEVYQPEARMLLPSSFSPHRAVGITDARAIKKASRVVLLRTSRFKPLGENSSSNGHAEEVRRRTRELDRARLPPCPRRASRQHTVVKTSGHGTADEKLCSVSAAGAPESLLGRMYLRAWAGTPHRDSRRGPRSWRENVGQLPVEVARTPRRSAAARWSFLITESASNEETSSVRTSRLAYPCPRSSGRNFGSAWLDCARSWNHLRISIYITWDPYNIERCRQFYTGAM